MTQSSESVRVPVGEFVFDVEVSDPAGRDADAPTVLALHGFPETKASWRRVAADLAAGGLRVIAPDQRGYSPDARPQAVEDYRIDLLVADAIGLLDALGVAQAHVVGHDWGAIVAWFLAARHPDRVASLTAVSVPHPSAFGWAIANDEDQQRRSQYIGVFRREGGVAEKALLSDDARGLRAVFGTDVPAELVDEHVAALSAPGALTAALSWYRAMTADFADLPAVTVPTTYLWSDADIALGRAGAERCGQYVDAPYRFIELPGISHWIPEQAPEQVVAAVRERVAG